MSAGTDADNSRPRLAPVDLSTFDYEILYGIAARGGDVRVPCLEALLADRYGGPVDIDDFHTTLTTLCDAGILDETAFSDGTPAYALTTAGERLLHRDVQRRRDIIGRLAAACAHGGGE